MKKQSRSRSKLQLTRTTIRQLSSRRLAGINGGTVLPPSLGEPLQQNQYGGDSNSVLDCYLTLVDCP